MYFFRTFLRLRLVILFNIHFENFIAWVRQISRTFQDSQDSVFNSPCNQEQLEVTTRILVFISRPKNIKVLIAPDNVNPSLPSPSQEWRWAYFDLCLNKQCLPYVRTLFDFTQGETILRDFCKAIDALKVSFARTVQKLWELTMVTQSKAGEWDKCTYSIFFP